MTELSPKAYELARAARVLHYPTLSDRQRIEQALRARLGPECFQNLPTAHGAATAARASFTLTPTGLVGAGMIVAAGLIGGTFLRAHSTDATPASGATSASSTPRSAALSVADIIAQPPTPAPLPAADAQPVPEPERAPAKARPAGDRLAQEVALMARATSSLRAHRASDALKALDEHQRLFPSGLLAEERHAARAQALCELGRQSEARADIASLKPQSIAAARTAQACSQTARASR